MKHKNPHLLTNYSLFCLFCLSYIPLFVLIIIKILITNKLYINWGGFEKEFIILFFEKFGFVAILILLGIFAIFGVKKTISNIKANEGNSWPVRIVSIKSKNEEALSYLVSYVVPLLFSGNFGLFEYCAFIILFTIYFMLYSTSNLILINPILNIKYGLFEIEYLPSAGNNYQKSKTALIISQHKWINEDDELNILKLGHCLYFGFLKKNN